MAYDESAEKYKQSDQLIRCYKPMEPKHIQNELTTDGYKIQPVLLEEKQCEKVQLELECNHLEPTDNSKDLFDTQRSQSHEENTHLEEVLSLIKADCHRRVRYKTVWQIDMIRQIQIEEHIHCQVNLITYEDLLLRVVHKHDQCKKLKLELEKLQQELKGKETAIAHLAKKLQESKPETSRLHCRDNELVKDLEKIHYSRRDVFIVALLITASPVVGVVIHSLIC